MGRSKGSPTKRRIARTDDAGNELPMGRLVTPERRDDLFLRDLVETAMGNSQEERSTEAVKSPPRKQRRVVKSATSKGVSFVESSPPATVIDPEVEISSAAGRDGEVVWEIRIGKETSEENIMEAVQLFGKERPLKVYHLLRTKVSAGKATVRTAAAAVRLLEHCETVCESARVNADLSSLGAAIEDGTLSLECRVMARNLNVAEVVVSLADSAFEVCSASKLPHSSRRRTSKPFRPVHTLQKALACLFPETVVADVVHPLPSRGPVTSKMVYDLVDNVKLREYEEDNGYESKSMDIPGLIPTLRPYQEAAVKWMLRQERRDDDQNRAHDLEWELAWVVIASPVVSVHDSSISSRSFSGEVATMPSWKLQTRSEVIESGLLYCPFFGFLAKSGAAAYKATMESFSKSGMGYLWEKASGGILAESMGLGKTVEVLACVLAHRLTFTQERHPFVDIGDSSDVGEEKRAEGNASVNQSEDEFEFDDDVSADSMRPADGQLYLDKWVDDFGACACGLLGSYNGCLALVMCQSCRMPLHGACAGFESLEQLHRLARVEKEGDALNVRVCSEDRCPSCMFRRVQKSESLVPSRAKLIITPASILSQWQRELRRHADPSQKLKVVIYPGIRELCRGLKPQKDFHLVHPRLLADADIVLMTFDALMGDLGHSDDNPFVQDSAGLRLRTAKRYRITPSPLLSIRWWRVALDEAQRVEAPTAISARMAQKLVCQHRWCVSGTPIGRGKLDDLYGLFLFLRLGPFSSKDWFQNCLRREHRGVGERIQHLLSSSIWRSTKTSESVKEQMRVPEQIERKTILKFSSIERHFYERQLEETLVAFHDVSHAGRKRKSADDLLASHMHKLRAACCHPQVGSSGISRPKTRRSTHFHARHEGHRGIVVSTGVLSMDQILDKLIEDARAKCEESQRLAVMHSNAMASLQYLKVEAKAFDVKFAESDKMLLEQSCRTYMEALELTDANARPTPVVGEAIMSGSNGFLSSRQVMQDGKASLAWQLKQIDGADLDDLSEVWSRIDFETVPKKIVELKVRPLIDLSGVSASETIEKGSALLIQPKTLVFQVSNAALGGEFIDVLSYSLDSSVTSSIEDTNWLQFSGFVTNKAKSWRLVLKDFNSLREKDVSRGSAVTYVVGIDVQILEADIAADSLQRLHVLHNASSTMASLLQLPHEAESQASFMSEQQMKDKTNSMKNEASKIESLYLDMAKGVHLQSQRLLSSITEERTSAEQELLQLSNARKSQGSRACADCFDDQWWDDLLSIYALYGSPHEHRALCERVERDLHDFIYSTEEGHTIGSATGPKSSIQSKSKSRAFPDFTGVSGLRTALSFRFRDFREEAGPGSHGDVIQSILQLSDTPKDDEVYENSHCRKCRKDWNQSGPECRHCKLETILEVTVEVDHLIITILRSLSRSGNDGKGSSRLASARREAKIGPRIGKFFAVLNMMEREVRAARVAWRTHFDLLSDIDEMNQCKRSMRLAAIDEDFSSLTPEEQGSIVLAADVGSRYMDHGAKQAMALANLRRSQDTLRYLKNQRKEELEESVNKPSESTKTDTDNQCIVCLSSFDGECAVLACGHRFHNSPCLEKLIARSGSRSVIRCPLRCTVTTKREAVMIASNKRRDDGSRIARHVKGSWGTKVTRLVAEVMDVADAGEKSIVFSQWEDMLEVVEHALSANGFKYVRAKSLAKLGESVKAFRSSDCAALLMNVKNGAEGLTLVEATHVFIVEPLLNCGLDAQAISRIHRIGQSCKTYVHRYLIEDTIEVKIDAMRVGRQAEQLEDALYESRQQHDVSAGGIDGGFSHMELQEILK